MTLLITNLNQASLLQMTTKHIRSFVIATLGHFMELWATVTGCWSLCGLKIMELCFQSLVKSLVSTTVQTATQKIAY